MFQRLVIGKEGLGNGEERPETKENSGTLGIGATTTTHILFYRCCLVPSLSKPTVPPFRPSSIPKLNPGIKCSPPVTFTLSLGMRVEILLANLLHLVTATVHLSTIKLHYQGRSAQQALG